MSEITLPEGWLLTSLGEIADWGAGGTPSRKTESFYGGTIPWVKTGDLGQKVLTQASEFITEQAVANSSAKFFPKGSVAIAMYGATIGKTSILGIDATTNQACGVGNPIKGITFTEFLYYMLCNEKDKFIAKGKGGAQPNISQALIKEHEIALPPLAEQQQIAQKLDELLAQVDTLKTRLDAIPKILKRFRQSVLAAAVSGRLTEEWRVQRKINLTVEEYERAIAIDNFKFKFASDNPVIETENGWLKLALGQLLTVSSGDGLTSKDMQEGDIPVYGGNGINGHHNKANFTEQKVVIGRVGFYCGSVHFTQERSWVTDNALVVNFPKSLVDIKFIYSLLRATNLREDSASTAQPVISGSKIYPIELMLPPLEEQTEIVRRVEQLFAYADQIEQRVKDAQARVNHLTQSILAKAFRGELTADWRAQNPELISGENSAAALLERIKAERGVAVKPKRKGK